MLAFSGGPGGFREVREAGRNHFPPFPAPLPPHRGDTQDTDFDKDLLKDFVRMFSKNSGLQNSGLLLEFRVLVGIER